MDPDLKAATRGMKTGSREYQAAVAKFNEDKARRELAAADAAARRQREGEDAASERKRAEGDAEANRQRAAREAQDARDRQTGIVTAGSVAGGLGTGLAGAKYADKVATQAADAVLKSRGEAITSLAKSARAINPQTPNAGGLYRDIAAAADRSGVVKPRVVPYGTGMIGGGLLAGGAYSSFDRAPQAKSDTERAIWTGTGYGEMSAGAKMIADSVRRFANPSRALPAEDIAAIEGARRIGAGGKPSPLTPGADASAFGQPATETPSVPAKAGPKPGTKADLYQQAKKLDLPVKTRMTKGEIASTLATSLRKAASKAPKALVPAAVGYGVYDALRSPAAADDGSPASGASVPEAAAAGAGVAGATAAGIEGARRLAQGPLGRALMRVGGRVVAPVGAVMTARDVANMALDRPEISGDMPQTPGNPDFFAGQTAATGQVFGRHLQPMSAASGLEIPQGIPAPREDGASPYGDAMAPPDSGGGFDGLIAASQDDPELADMLRQAILARIGEAQTDQIPNALAGQGVASRGDDMANALRNFAQR